MSTRILTGISCLLLLFCGDARSDALSTLFLPAHIEADDGVLAVRADFGGVDSSGRIPVYLVNRMDRPVTLVSDNNAFDLKLEYLDDNGNWTRAQPHYPSYGCFRSMYVITLDPGHFVVLDGFQRVNGETRQVRYRLRTDDFEVVTNQGQGVVAAIDVERAAHDIMAIKNADFAQVSAILLDQTYATNDRMIEYARYLAIDELSLGRFDLDDSRDALRELESLRPDLRKIIRWAMASLDEVEARVAQ